MNTHAYTAQQHVPTNQPQNSVKFVIDELTGQHQGIVEHIVSAINRLGAEAEQSRKLDEAARNEIFMLLGNRLSCLEGSVRALDGKVDLLSHEMRQVGAKLALAEERISVIGHSMDRAVDILRDPGKQRANIPVQVGVPSAKKRVSFAPPRTESGSPDDAQPGPSAVLNISALADTRSSSFIERDLFSPPITSEDYSNPPAPSSSVSTRTNSDIDETESHTLVPLRPRKRQKTESRSPSAISALFASDLSELTDSEEEEEQTVAIRSIKVEEPPVRRQSRRISDTTRERALVLFRKPVQALVQSKPRYKRKRRSGLMHRKKGVSKKTTINASQGVHTDYGMVLCDGCSRWYHGVCVNLPSDIVENMDENEPWYCPVCPPTSDINFVKMEPSREGGCCAVQCILGDDGYSVDGIVGRKPDVDNPPHFLWLIKWYEFGIEECTWKPTHTFDGPTLIKEFYAAAQAEGISPAYLTSNDSADNVILLNEAMHFTGSWATSYD